MSSGSSITERTFSQMKQTWICWTVSTLIAGSAFLKRRPDQNRNVEALLPAR
jgi:hypothetical protein